MKQLYTAFLVALPVLLGSCDDHVYGTSMSGCATEPPLTWENFGYAFLDNNCNGCHSHFHEGRNRSGAPDGVDFDTWELSLIHN